MEFAVTQVLLAALFLTAAAAASPALAAESCKTQGKAAAVEIPIIGANDAASLERAQMTVEALQPDTTRQLGNNVACIRGYVVANGVTFTIGGENGDPFPRVAASESGSRTGYLYAVPGSAVGLPTAYVLAVTDSSGETFEKAVFNGIPADSVLIEAFRKALESSSSMVTYDGRRNTIAYGFQTTGVAAPAPPPLSPAAPASVEVASPGPTRTAAPTALPTPVPPSPAPAAPAIASAPIATAMATPLASPPPPSSSPRPAPIEAAPIDAPTAPSARPVRPSDPLSFQVIMDGGPGRQFMDFPPGNHHRPSGFTCPPVIVGADIRLNRITPDEDSVSCQYVPGVQTPADVILAARYQMTLSLAADATISAAIDRFGGATRERNPGATVHPAPPPPPGFYVSSALMDTPDGRVVGVWVGKSGDWLAVLRVDYPAGVATETEAAAVVSQLFLAFYAEVGDRRAPPGPP